MKKVRKGKKMLLILLIAIVVIVAAVIIIVNVVKNKNGGSDTPATEEQQIISLPETTTASGMDAEKIYMQYLKDNNQTMVEMRITNNTGAKVPAEEFNAILIGPDENILGELRTGTNVALEAGEQCDISVIYKGDLTATQKIKLQPLE